LISTCNGIEQQQAASAGTSAQLLLFPEHHCSCCCRYDESNHKRYAPGLDNKSPATLVQAGGRFFYATAARLLALKFILSMSVSTRIAAACGAAAAVAAAAASLKRQYLVAAASESGMAGSKMVAATHGSSSMAGSKGNSQGRTCEQQLGQQGRHTEHLLAQGARPAVSCIVHMAIRCCTEGIANRWFQQRNSSNAQRQQQLLCVFTCTMHASCSESSLLCSSPPVAQKESI
jgi:hypothetical protein